MTARLFDTFSRRVELAIGTPWAFVLACGSIILWLICGPLFQWSSDWQLIVNTGTTILTWLMLFLLQATQTRDTAAMHVKLDELIHATDAARNAVIAAEDMAGPELDEVRRDLQRAAKD